MTHSPDPDAPDHTQDDKPDLAGFLHSESPRRASAPDPTESLRRPPPPPGDPGGDNAAYESVGDMRDMEKSLVERIADVDDDRRRTAVQLRKALDTHRDEIRAQRHRDHTALLVLTGIGIVLLAAVLLLFNQLVHTRSNLQDRLQQLQTATTAPQSSAQATTDAIAALRQRIDRLEQATDGDNATDALAAQLAQLKTQIETQRQAQRQSADTLGELDQRLTQLETASAALRPDLAATADSLTALQQRIDRLEQATDGDNATDALAAQLAQLEAQLETQLETQRQPEDTLSELDQRLTQLETASAALRPDLATTADSLTALQQRIDRLEQAAGANDATDALAAQLAQLEAQLETQLETQRQPEDTLSELDQRLTKLEQRPAGADTRADIDALSTGIEGNAGRLATLADQLDTLTDAQAETAAMARRAVSPESNAAALASAVAAAEQRLQDQLTQRLAALSTQIDTLREALTPPPAEPAPEPAPQPAPEPAPESAADSSAADTLRTDAGTIALQLAGFPSRSAIDRFIARHSLPEQIYLSVDSRRGRAWYGLVHSLHADMAAAEAARAQLPPELARLDIWLRPLPAGTPLQRLDGGS